MASGSAPPATHSPHLLFVPVTGHEQETPADVSRSPPPKSVVKRDGTAAEFDLERIRSAIARAGAATGELDGAEAHLLARQVCVRLSRRGTPPHVEEIQDAVEHLLIDSGYTATARAYIVYREQHHKLRRHPPHAVVDVANSINEYLDRSDWRINANANQGYSPRRADPEHLRQDHRQLLALPRLPARGRRRRTGTADLHIHDLDMLSGYCAGWSLKTLLTGGAQRRPGQGGGGPRPKHLELRGRPDGQLPRLPAERVGRRPGVQLLRHLPGALHPQGRTWAMTR